MPFLLFVTLIAGFLPSAQAEPATTSSPGTTADGAQHDPQRLRCNEHDTYEDECFICHPELREKGRLWCSEHGRYEDRCFLCHPELRDETRPYCEKHFLYQDECHLCRPELKKRSSNAPSATRPVLGDVEAGGTQPLLMCKEHGVPEAECGICHPELAASLPAGAGLKVRLPSAESAQKAGIETAMPEVAAVTDDVECYAEIVFARDRVAEISSPVSGRVAEVAVELGARVAAGSVLATVASPVLAEAVNAERLAKHTLERERSLYAQKISAQKDLQAAEAAYETARQTLVALGVSGEDSHVSRNGHNGAALVLRAPFAGEVVARDAVNGAVVDPGRPLFVVADRTAMWAELAVPEDELDVIEVGQSVELTLDAAPGRVFAGTLTWVAAQIDERTRMARAIAEVPNPDGSLRAQSFARARIVTSPAAPRLTVPRSAIQNVEGNSIAFVKLSDDLYEARAVRVDAKDTERVAVDGLSPDDEVVVTRSFLVKSQLQISRLGAGCTD